MPNDTSIPTAFPTDTSIPATSTPSAGDIWTRPNDGALMVYVPAGRFFMGSLHNYPHAFYFEKPLHPVDLDAFWIDEHEVTNAQYRRCMEEGTCEKSSCLKGEISNAPDQPVVCVSWNDAQVYAAWVGGRLPTEAEWEKACKGTEGRIWPWGDSAPDCSKANYWTGSGCATRPLPVRSHPGGAGPYGALDMAGNVAEWVQDWFAVDYYARAPLQNPQGPDSGDARVMRGGSFEVHAGYARCASRLFVRPDNRSIYSGFRVMVAPSPAGP
jgi:formylglycine-generating enzyme required for sulfatase activity